MMVTNLGHYLGKDLSLINIPAPAAALREFLGCIVEVVTSREPDDENHGTELRCRQGCESIVIAFYDKTDSSIIHWSCSSCDDRGRITGWQDTVWDKSIQ